MVPHTAGHVALLILLRSFAPGRVAADSAPAAMVHVSEYLELPAPPLAPELAPSELVYQLGYTGVVVCASQAADQSCSPSLHSVNPVDCSRHG